jgi:hypothetical protein
MGKYASGKRSLAISDRSGMAFPYTEMVREWNGSLVHTSEYESKQPQLSPRPVGSDPQALWNPRPQPDAVASLILLNPNPFTSIIYNGVVYLNVYSEDHQRSTGDIVRFRGAPQVISTGSGGPDTPNLQSFAYIPLFASMQDNGTGGAINRSTGFTIALGQIDSSGNVTGATTTNPLTNPINYFYVTLGAVGSVADGLPLGTVSGISGGGSNASAGPVTLKVING